MTIILVRIDFIGSKLQNAFLQKELSVIPL